MDKRPGRFTLDSSKTMRIGTVVYRELIKKMLSVHIATMERKMRACVQCPPRCAVPPTQNLKKRPYTTTFKKQPFIPRHLLSTYVTNAINTAEVKQKTRLTIDEERRIRRRMEIGERNLRDSNGLVDVARQDQRLRLHLANAQLGAYRPARRPPSGVVRVAAPAARTPITCPADPRISEGLQVVAPDAAAGTVVLDGFASPPARRRRARPLVVVVPKPLETPAIGRVILSSATPVNEYTAAVDQAKIDIARIMASDLSEEQKRRDLKTVSDKVQALGSVPDELFADVPEDLYQQTAAVEVASGTADPEPLVFGEGALVEGEGVEASAITEIEDADASQPLPPLLAVASNQLADHVDFLAEAGQEGPSVTPSEAGHREEEEKIPDLPNEADELAAVFAGRLASGDRHAFKKQMRSFFGDGGMLRSDRTAALWPGPGELPGWAGRIYQNLAGKRNHFVNDLMGPEGREDIDNAEDWIPILKALFALPEHRWMLPGGAASASAFERRLLGDLALEEEPAPSGREAGEEAAEAPAEAEEEPAQAEDMNEVLEKAYGQKYHRHITLGLERNMGNFIMETIPHEHFQALSLVLEKAQRLYDASNLFYASFQNIFYETCLQEDSILTSEANNITEYEQEVHAALGTNAPGANLMWRVPEDIRSIPHWPGGTVEEIPVFYKSISHLFCPVWREAVDDDGDTMISYGVPQRVNCAVPDLGRDIPIPVSQLRIATGADVKANPNVFDESDDDESSYYPTPRKKRR